MTNKLSGGSGQITAIVTITRKATGEVETYNLTGVVSPEQIETLEREAADQQEQPQ